MLALITSILYIDTLFERFTIFKKYANIFIQSVYFKQKRLINSVIKFTFSLPEEVILSEYEKS